MTIAVAYSMSAAGRLATRRAVDEARAWATDLAVVHVVGSQDAEKVEAYRAGISEAVAEAVAGGADVPWQLHLRTAVSDADVDDVLVELIEELAVDMVVIGARRRSPLGKALLGSTAQKLILSLSVPVLVVKDA